MNEFFKLIYTWIKINTIPIELIIYILEIYQRFINNYDKSVSRRHMISDKSAKEPYDVSVLKNMVMKYPEMTFGQLKGQVRNLIQTRSEKLQAKLIQAQKQLYNLVGALNDYGLTGKPDLMSFFQELKHILDQNKLPSLFSEYCSELYPIFIKVASLSISDNLTQEYDLSFNGLEVILKQCCEKYGVTEEEQLKRKTQNELIKDKKQINKDASYCSMQDLGFTPLQEESQHLAYYSPRLERGGGEKPKSLIKKQFHQAQDNQTDITCTSWKAISDCLTSKIPFQELKEYFFANQISNLGDLPIKLKEQLERLLKINRENLTLNQDILIKSTEISWKFVNSLFSETLFPRTQLANELQQFRKQCLNSKKGFPGLLIGRVAPQPQLLIYHKKKYDKVKTNNLLNFLKEPKQKSRQYQQFQQKLQFTKTDSHEKFYASSFHFAQEVHSFEELAEQLPKLSLLISELQVKLIMIGDFEFGVDKEKIRKYYNPKHNRYYLLNKKSQIRYPNFQATFFQKPLFDEKKRGGFPYYCPGGWMRISLRVTENEKQFDSKYQNWRVAYQGTYNQQNLYSILTTGFRAAVGCYSAINKIQVPVAYFSPSIQYASKYFNPFYDPYQKKWVTIVLQVRIDPNKIVKKGKHTLPNIFTVEEHFKDKQDEYEWLMRGKTELKKGEEGKKFGKSYEQNLFPVDGVIPYGIMIKLTDQRPSFRNDTTTKK